MEERSGFGPCAVHRIIERVSLSCSSCQISTYPVRSVSQGVRTLSDGAIPGRFAIPVTSAFLAV